MSITAPAVLPKSCAHPFRNVDVLHSLVVDVLHSLLRLSGTAVRGVCRPDASAIPHDRICNRPLTRHFMATLPPCSIGGLHPLNPALARDGLSHSPAPAQHRHGLEVHTLAHRDARVCCHSARARHPARLQPLPAVARESGEAPQLPVADHVTSTSNAYGAQSFPLRH